jgi:DNA-binding Lrp family transcriptional regulator
MSVKYGENGNSDGDGVDADTEGELTETRDATPGAVSMVLRARTPVCGSRTTVINRLGRLRATGVIDEFEVRTWPDEVVLSAETDGGEAVETFEQFERWADDRGLSVRPAFDVKTVSSIVGRTRELLTLPMMSLAVSIDGDLVGVFPCSDGERTWTIVDCLDAYEADDDPLAALEPVGPT